MFVDNISANDEKKTTNTTITNADLNSGNGTIETASLSNLPDFITDEDVININNSADEDETKDGVDDNEPSVDDSDNEGSETVDKEVKRTINYANSNSRFTQPIVVSEGNLFTPAEDELPKKQINVQIIQPEPHNNGQYLKETVFLKETNTTTSSTTTVTSTTTDRGLRLGKAKSKVPSKYLAPIQAGLRLSNDDGHKLDDDCDDTTEPILVLQKTTPQQKTIVDIQKNTKIKKVTVQNEQPTALVFGARYNVKQTTTTPPPCGQPAKCTPEINLRILPPTPSTPQIFTPTTPKTIITQKPIYIHTHTEVPVEKIVTRPVPYPVEVEKLVVKEVKVPVDRIVEKHIDRPVHIPIEKQVEKIVHVPYAVQSIVERPVEKIVTQQVAVPVDRIVEKIIDLPVEVEKVIEKQVPIAVDRVVEKLIDRPIAVPYEKIVEKPIPYVVEKFIEKFIDRPIPVHVPFLVQVGVPIREAVPYPVEVPIYIKPQPKHYYIIKTKHHKGLHSFFDFKHNNHKSTKHIFIKHPSVIAEDIGYVPSSLPSVPPPSIAPKYIPLEREPRYQSTADSYSSASINFVHTALPNSYQPSLQTYYGPPPIQNSLTNFDSKLNKYSNGLDFKDIRWEYGFKPPLIPSVEIDEFGNPIHRNH